MFLFCSKCNDYFFRVKKILESISRFDISVQLPRKQKEICAKSPSLRSSVKSQSISKSLKHNYKIFQQNLDQKILNVHEFFQLPINDDQTSKSNISNETYSKYYPKKVSKGNYSLSSKWMDRVNNNTEIITETQNSNLESLAKNKKNIKMILNSTSNYYENECQDLPKQTPNLATLYTNTDDMDQSKSIDYYNRSSYAGLSYIYTLYDIPEERDEEPDEVLHI